MKCDGGMQMGARKPRTCLWRFSSEKIMDWFSEIPLRGLWTLPFVTAETPWGDVF